jgi:hypothetical protein
MAIAEAIPLCPPFFKGGLRTANSLPLFEKACPERGRREGVGEICKLRKRTTDG